MADPACLLRIREREARARKRRLVRLSTVWLWQLGAIASLLTVLMITVR